MDLRDSLPKTTVYWAPAPGSRQSEFAVPSVLPDYVPVRWLRCEQRHSRKVENFAIFEAVIIACLLAWEVLR